MKKILLITGPAGDAQGWGDIAVTQSIKQAIDDSGKTAQIAFVNNMDEFYASLEKNTFDIAWSALYHVSGKSETIGMGEGDEKWVADIFDDKDIPYIGPDAKTMKNLIHKTSTHKILKNSGIFVPYHYQLGTDDALPDIVYPAFVKPSYESRSVGISDLCSFPCKICASLIENSVGINTQVNQFFFVRFFSNGCGCTKYNHLAVRIRHKIFMDQLNTMIHYA